MVTALGAGPREQHTVPPDAAVVGDGMSAAYVAECGALCMEAFEQFAAGVPWCPSCRH